MLAEDLGRRLKALFERGESDSTLGMETLEQMLATAMRCAERIGGQGCVAMPPELPMADELVPTVIGTVLENLLDNAIRATSDRQPIRLVIQQTETEIVLGVQDGGMGMSAEVLERATVRGFSTRRASGGRGLGLATSKAIVDRLGGRLELISTEGMGTTALIYIPKSA
jgi:signal transduction histidine kinase